MAKVTVTPEKFELVFFDADEITRIAEKVAEAVGLPDDTHVEINVDEAMMMGRSNAVLEGNKLVLEVTGGSFEDQRRSRHMSPERTERVLALKFLRARDRLDPAFGNPPADTDLTPGQGIAWDVYTEGRLDRTGLPTRQQRLRYHFRVRHGFNDVADDLFQRLWTAESVTWAQIQEIHETGTKNREELQALSK
jgi:hypothetical protein